jgi:FG-GAP-like repeat
MFGSDGSIRRFLRALGVIVLGFTTPAVAQFAGFGDRVDIGLGSVAPTNSVAGDFDGDGDIDLAFPMSKATTFDTVAVILNNGDGTFSSSSFYDIGGDPRDIVAGDVDLDGDLDLVIANSDSNDCSVLRNIGDGTFLPEVFFSVGASPKGVALSDVNADGLPDIISTSSIDNTVTVTLGDGSGIGWTPSVTMTTNNNGGTGGVGPRAIIVRDLNADSLPDIVTANLTSGTCTVFYNIPGNPGQFFSGDFAIFVNVGNTPLDVQVGDVDRDGDLDLVVANRDSSTVSTRLSNFSGGGITFPTFNTGSNYSVPAGPIGLSLADIDNPPLGFDGDLDIIVSSELASQIGVLINNGSGIFTLDSVYNTLVSPKAPAVGDLDSDGDIDVAVPNFSSAAVSLFFNQSTVVGGAPPVVDLISPLENGCLCAGINPIIGTVSAVSGTTLASYTLEYRRLGTSGFTPIATGTMEIINNVVGNWDTTGLAEDRYLLRLRASNTGGISASDEIVVLLSTQLDVVEGIFAAGLNSGSGDVSSASIIGGIGCVYGSVRDWISCDSVSYTVDYRPISGGAFSPVDPSMPVYVGQRINQTLASWDTINGIPDGDFEVRVVGSNDCDTNTDLFTVRVDNTPPVGDITSPESCVYRSPGESIQIFGTASDTNLAGWTLQYTGGDASGWITIASGSSNINNAMLGTWDTTGLRPCAYTVRLLVSDQAVLNCGFGRHQTSDMISFDLRCQADLTEDGTLNFFDVSAFLQAFAAGCP